MSVPKPHGIERPGFTGYLAVALDVHMTSRGMYERSEQEQSNDIAILKRHLEDWYPRHIHSNVEFDNACKRVMELAIEEAEEIERADIRTTS